MTNSVSVNVNCPFCKRSLMDQETKLLDKPSIRMIIEQGEARGIIHLCSVYGSYDHKSDMDIPEGNITVFSCPQCNKNLNTTGLCDNCGAPLVSFNLDIGGKVSICSRKGCKKHYVVFEDINDALKLFRQERGGFVNEI